MLALTILKVHNSICDLTEENNKVKRFIFPYGEIGGVSYEKVRDEIDKDLEVTYITVIDLQDD